LSRQVVWIPAPLPSLRLPAPAKEADRSVRSEALRDPLVATLPTVLHPEPTLPLFLIKKSELPISPTCHCRYIGDGLKTVMKIRMARDNPPVGLDALSPLALQGKGKALRPNHRLNAGHYTGEGGIDPHHRHRKVIERADTLFRVPLNIDPRYMYLFFPRSLVLNILHDIFLIQLIGL